MISAFIFDLDGVIVDTAKYHFTAWQRLGRELGIDLNSTHERQLRGVSREGSLQKILDWAGETRSAEDFKALTDKKNGWYQELIHHMDRSELLDCVQAFVEQAKMEGIALGIASGSKNASAIVEGLRLNDYFSVCIDGNDLTKGKPDPQVFQLAATALKVAPEQAIVFEDAPSGIAAAHAGGFYAVGIGSAEDLPNAKLVLPNLCNQTPAQLIEQLLG